MLKSINCFFRKIDTQVRRIAAVSNYLSQEGKCGKKRRKMFGARNVSFRNLTGHTTILNDETILNESQRDRSRDL